MVVTDRGNPIAVLHSLDQIEVTAPAEERLAALARQGMIRIPSGEKKCDMVTKAIHIKGKPLSRIVIEDRGRPAFSGVKTRK